MQTGSGGAIKRTFAGRWTGRAGLYRNGTGFSKRMGDGRGRMDG